MVWTATLIEKEYIVGKDKVGVLVTYTDGINTVLNTYYVDGVIELRDLVIRRIKELDRFKTTFDNLPIGATITQSQTQNEIDKNTYFNNLNKYKNFKDLVSLGILTNIDGVTLLNTLTSTFKPEYLN